MEKKLTEQEKELLLKSLDDKIVKLMRNLNHLKKEMQKEIEANEKYKQECIVRGVDYTQNGNYLMTLYNIEFYENEISPFEKELKAVNDLIEKVKSL